MSLINERHVDTDRAGDAQGGGNFATLQDFLNRRRVTVPPFNEADHVVNAQFTLINASNFPGTIALGTASQETDGGYVAAALPGAVGTAANTTVLDSLGNITNLVEVREASSHDPLLDGSGRRIYGLLQAASTVGDGDAVGASGSENLQVSFVVIDASSALVLSSVNATVEFALGRLYAERHMPVYFKEGQTAEADIIAPSSVPGEPVVGKFAVTAGFAANETITIATGAGAATGAATPSGDSIASIGATSGEFIAENRTRIRLNGDQLTKGVDCNWVSASTFSMAVPMDPGDTFEVEVAE